MPADVVNRRTRSDAPQPLTPIGPRLKPRFGGAYLLQSPRGRLSWRPLSFLDSLAVVLILLIGEGQSILLTEARTVCVKFIDLIEAALKAVPTKPTPTPAQRRKSFRVIQGDLFE